VERDIQHAPVFAGRLLSAVSLFDKQACEDIQAALWQAHRGMREAGRLLTPGHRSYSQDMDCARRRCLEQIHQKARAIFDARRERLLERFHECSVSEFLMLNDEIHRAWELFNHVRARLEGHTRQHGCLGNIAVAASEGRK
jgi:hypothetical protein